MLTGVHFLLTYKCTFECDHCFLYCGPQADGTFTLATIKAALLQMTDIKSITSAYFEGGEPFLYYSLMIESVRLAKGYGYDVGIVTNGYWATSRDDAILYLKPLAEIGISDLSVSDDSLHYNEREQSLAKNAIAAAAELGIPCESICIEAPKVIRDDKKWQGEPVVGGDVLFRGRAVDKLLDNLPRRPFSAFEECPHENLKDPGRVHLDPFGNVHLCQGIVIGNVNDMTLAEIMKTYDPGKHPIIAPLLSGGPAELAMEYGFDSSPGFVDHCHLCFEIRRRLVGNFPKYLAPPQVYGQNSEPS